MDNCYVLKPNGTESIPGWEGIPESIVLNALFATLFMIVLAVLRIVYFKQKPYQNDWNISWLQFIYSDRNVSLLHKESNINRLHPNAYLPPCLHEYSPQIVNKLEGKRSENSLYFTNNVGERRKQKHQEKLNSVGKYRFWLLDYILIKDKDIYEHRGNDAFQYLLFQRYIIYFLTALTAVCMIILMPINIFGKSGEQNYFEMTTINNIDGSSEIFWIHSIIAIAVVILGLLMMKNFSDLIFTPAKQSDERTILIQNVPESKRNARVLKTFLEKKFVGIEVTQISFSYDVDMLNDLKLQLETINSAIVYCRKYREEYGRPLMICPYFGGRFNPFVSTVDATKYYHEQQQEYQLLITEEVNRLLSDPKHAVFVQLRNEVMALRILEHFESTRHERIFKRIWKYFKGCFVRSAESKQQVVDTFCYNSWIIKQAPFPDDVEWKDIIMNTNTSGICELVLNVTILIMFIFLTTPLVAMSFLEEIISKIGMRDSIAPINEIQIGAWKLQLAKYFSILTFNTISMILPNLVMLIMLFTPRNTKSEKTYRATIGVFFFLICMVFICPSIGLSSGLVLIKKIFDNQDNGGQNLYRCLFPPASSAWFVQMVISSIFFTDPFEIMRLSDLSLYLLYCIIYPRTEAEYIKARMVVNFNFNYASSYPRFLLIFTIVTTYSIACPIIAPFGLLYMLLKYLADRYSIYYLYNAPVISPHIHRMAIMFVLGSFFFLLLQLTAFLNSRIDFSLSFKPSNVCSVALLLYTILMCFTWCNFSSLYPKQGSALSGGGTETNNRRNVANRTAAAAARLRARRQPDEPASRRHKQHNPPNNPVKENLGGSGASVRQAHSVLSMVRTGSVADNRNHRNVDGDNEHSSHSRVVS